MIHHYFPGRRLKYSYSYSLGQSNSLNATETAMDKILHIMSLAVLLNEIPLQAALGINTCSNLSFQVFLPRHLFVAPALSTSAVHGARWVLRPGWFPHAVLCLCCPPPFESCLPAPWRVDRLFWKTDEEQKEKDEVLSPLDPWSMKG